jgi:hexulose-6-phosphate isomerase
MTMHLSHGRRNFIGGAIAAGAGLAAGLGPSQPALARAAKVRKPVLRKAVKYSMVKITGSALDKLSLVKSLGFQGVEIDSPNKFDRKELAAARDKTGVVIHGVIDSIHWKTRFSDPDPAVRSAAVEGLKTAIDDAKFYGATTVLIVPGAVKDKEKENFDQVWARSQEEIRKALPQARKLGVKIAIEVVWNDFLTTPDLLIKYVDEFRDPTVGAYFDVSNMIKYGVPPADWIRKLGKRMLKFDFKGYSHERKWVPIGEGDENWPAVLEALADVGYSGFATAEVSGGGEKELSEIAARMDRVLGLKPPG